MAFSFRLEDLNIKLLLEFSEKQKGACSLAQNQLKGLSIGCSQLFVLF